MTDADDAVADVVYRAELLEDLGSVTVMGRQYVAADLLPALMAGAAARELDRLWMDPHVRPDWTHLRDRANDLRDRAHGPEGRSAPKVNTWLFPASDRIDTMVALPFGWSLMISRRTGSSWRRTRLRARRAAGQWR